MARSLEVRSRGGPVVRLLFEVGWEAFEGFKEEDKTHMI